MSPGRGRRALRKSVRGLGARRRPRAASAKAGDPKMRATPWKQRRWGANPTPAPRQLRLCLPVTVRGQHPVPGRLGRLGRRYSR